MTKRETFTLLALIAVYYEQFEVNQKKIDVWHQALKTCDYDELETNLLIHVHESPYPPKIAQLTRKQATSDRVIPSFEETCQFLLRIEKPAHDAVIREELRKTRIILGLKKDR